MSSIDSDMPAVARCILTKMNLARVFCKVFLKYCKFFMREKEIKKIIEAAAITWCKTKTRRRGTGNNLVDMILPII